MGRIKSPHLLLRWRLSIHRLPRSIKVSMNPAHQFSPSAFMGHRLRARAAPEARPISSALAMATRFSFLHQALNTSWHPAVRKGVPTSCGQQKHSSTEKSTGRTTLHTPKTVGSRRSLLRLQPQGSGQTEFLPGLQCQRPFSIILAPSIFLAASAARWRIRTSLGRYKRGLGATGAAGSDAAVPLPVLAAWRATARVRLQFANRCRCASVCGLHLLLITGFCFRRFGFGEPGCACGLAWLALSALSSLCVGWRKPQRYESQRLGASCLDSVETGALICVRAVYFRCVGFSAFF